MDDLLQEFVTETNESLAILDQDMVKFEQSPNDSDTLGRIFRVMHTIKGTCGFLGLSRLERVAHAGEDVLGRFRDGALEVSPSAVTLILRCLDRIREVITSIEQTGTEAEGDDSGLIGELKVMAEGNVSAAPPSIAPPAAPAPFTPTLSDAGFPVAQELLDECEAASPTIAPAPALVAPVAVVEAPVAAEIEEPAVGEKPAVAATKTSGGQTQAQAQSQTIRVTVDVLENLMTLVSEMVLTRNQLLQIVRSEEDSRLKGPVQRLNRVTTDLQESVMKTRMQPIGHAWNKLPRIVRDLGNELNKQINLDMHGEETELDRQVLELIRDPLTHMVRNSADHGLEGPAERVAAGKPAAGTVRLSAHHEGGHIIIAISDDGRGLNTEKIKSKIIEKGLATAAELDALDESQIHQYIMKPGFSTAEKITSVSGRGVGMDVVRSNIEKIGGTIEFRSVFGKGSAFTIKIPLTLAIVSALIVEASGHKFAIPQISVREIVRAGSKAGSQIETLAGAQVLRLRNRLLPLVNLGTALELGHSDSARNVVVCKSGSQVFGVVVDRIADAEEIVVKPLSEMLKGTGVYSGNTILGDGTVILILDTNALSSRLNADAQALQENEETGPVDQRKTQNILVFRSMSKGLKAVPLGDVHRIESVEMQNLEWIQGKPVIQYRDSLLPIVSLDGPDGIHREGNQPVLVFVRDDHMVGVAIDGIEDIVADEVRIERPSHIPGFHGSQVVSGRAVDYIDPTFYLAAAEGLEVPANGIEDLASHRAQQDASFGEAA